MFIPHFKHKSNNVPIISRSDIDFFAEAFIKNFQPEALTSPMELNIDLFVEDYLELVVDYQHLSSDQRYLGMTIFNDTRKVIIFNPNENQADYISSKSGTIIIDNSLLQNNQIHRYRFTIAHESAHWIFHKAYYGYNPNQLSLFEIDIPFIKCRDINKDYCLCDTQKWDDKKWMEWQADKFASAILMPRSSVLLFVEEYSKSHSPSELINDIVSVYNVSPDAAKYRLIDLGIIKGNKNNKYEQLSLF